jgi:hypothetical protein
MVLATCIARPLRLGASSIDLETMMGSSYNGKTINARSAHLMRTVKALDLTSHPMKLASYNEHRVAVLSAGAAPIPPIAVRTIETDVLVIGGGG